ncbi:type VI secretion system baseplate subunit TssG [Pseudomonas sp. NPDC077649]|uniref:type VI secretion system baseplate subunit TssG n=1 Tax=unclassified Pseudomonas TaxID=196821 RepID=UPI000396E4CF|nr:type VI secretion system baseplate subunit TssG [Pseudomonas sp. EGD-AK9]ERI51316.1 type VI secretion protein [Pseudomonas sp. EGD-AK9]
MAGTTGSPPEHLSGAAEMAAAPWSYDFFQALRRIECTAVAQPRIGRSVRLADDPLRLGQQPDCSFAPATLASVHQGPVPRIEQFFFGLTGPNGPLPLHLTEYARERQRNNGDATFKRFLDVFHHRLLTLFYRAWAEARPTVSHDRPDDDYWSMRLAALSGRGMPSLLGQGPLADSASLHFSGHLAAQTRYPDGLRSILEAYFEVPVRIEEYVGQWLQLPQYSQVGAAACTLGSDLCLGTHVWDRQHKFRIRLGPLSLEQYQRLLPGQENFAELAAWVAEHQGDELDWEINLVLRCQEVPRIDLDGGTQLGFNTWLGTPLHDPDDLSLVRDYASQSIPDSRSCEHE